PPHSAVPHAPRFRSSSDPRAHPPCDPPATTTRLRRLHAMDAGRRAFLAGITATGLAAAVPVLAADNRRRMASGQEPQYFFLTLPEAVFLTAFVDELIPADNRKSTRLNSSHVKISYAVFCLKKKKKIKPSLSQTTYTTTM